MIILLPYRASDSVKLIQSSFEKINLKCLNLENSRYLNTKELSEAERKNRLLDYLGGFELIDKEMRVFIFEGLSGNGNSMNQFYLANERQRPNDKKFKMLYNPAIRYKQRLYQEFNVAIKKIKLRDSLSSIMSAPDIYLRSKVPEDMYDTLQKFAEIRKLDRANLVRDFNLFPSVTNLLTLERKYGDSLLFEDLNGFKQKKKRKTRSSVEGGVIDASDSKSQATTMIKSSVNGETVKSTVLE